VRGGVGAVCWTERSLDNHLKLDNAVRQSDVRATDVTAGVL
jgi:hypothetical protein